MQRIMNDPDYIVDEMVEGFLKNHKDLVEKTANPRVLKSRFPTEGRVAVVTGGGSGHKPALLAIAARTSAMQSPLEKSVLPRQQPLFWMASKLQIREKVLPVCTETIPETT